MPVLSAPNLINNPQLIAATPTTEPKPGWFRNGMSAQRLPDYDGDVLSFSQDSGAPNNYYGPVESGTTYNNAYGAVGQYVTITATVRMNWGDSNGAARLKLQAGATVLATSDEVTGTDWTDIVLVGQISAGQDDDQLLWVLEFINPSLNDDILIRTGSVGLYVTDTDPTEGGGEPPANEPPSAPTNVVVGSGTSSTLAVSWDAATDDIGVVGYNVYNGTTKVNPVLVTALSTVIKGLTPETAYTFTVRAVDTNGVESTDSDPDTGTTTDAGAPGNDDPWSEFAALAASLAPRVAAYVGQADEAAAIAAAAEYVPTVAEYVRGYTRGRGWTGDTPAGPLKTVIVAAAARLLANPEQVSTYTLGDYSERPAVLAGWTLPERGVLNRYRKTAA